MIASVERRRRYSVDEKLRLIRESRRPGMSVSHVARAQAPRARTRSW
ncbi:MAG: transposase [Vulcanimicrobiaceae bacterium]